MDMNRNAIWRNPENVPKAGIERMNRFWGDESWRQAAYAEARQGNLFGTEIIKQVRFLQNLGTLRGFVGGFRGERT